MSSKVKIPKLFKVSSCAFFHALSRGIGSFHLKFSAQKLISLKLGIFIAFREYTEQVGEKKKFENSKIFFSKISHLSAKINGTNF